MNNKNKGYDVVVSFAFFLINIGFVSYLWFINNSGQHFIGSMIWCIINVLWIIISGKQNEDNSRSTIKKCSLCLGVVGLIIAIVTLAIYCFTISMP